MKLFFILVSIASLNIGLIAGIAIGKHEARKEAAKCGAAQWITDPRTGHTQFEYIVRK